MLVTASNDKTVCLWDARMLASKKKSKNTGSITQGRAVGCARFSPSGNRLVTTSYDDTLRVFDDVLESGLKKKPVIIRHNNQVSNLRKSIVLTFVQTGRWLTKFQAIFEPKNEDYILVGSMDRPRGLDVFHLSGRQVTHFTADYFESVSSLLVSHPTQNLICGGNSSGRVYTFKA